MTIERGVERAGGEGEARGFRVGVQGRDQPLGAVTPPPPDIATSVESPRTVQEALVGGVMVMASSCPPPPLPRKGWCASSRGNVLSRPGQSADHVMILQLPYPQAHLFSSSIPSPNTRPPGSTLTRLATRKSSATTPVTMMKMVKYMPPAPAGSVDLLESPPWRA